MANVKRPWLTYAMIGGLALLLGVLGVFQYRWLTRISESDGEKAKVRVREQAERFAADFNREIQNAYFNLQAGPEVFKEKDWAEFSRRYEFWRQNTAYPALVAEIYYLPKETVARVMRFDPESGTFMDASDSEQLTRIRSLLADEENFKPVDIASFTLLLPIHESGERMAIKMRAPEGTHLPPFKMPERMGYLAIRLDPAVVREQLLVDLTAKYFGDGEYRVSIDEKNGAYQGRPDATAPLFELLSENFVFYSNRDTVSALGAEKRDVMISSHIESHTMNRIESSDANGTVKIELKRDNTRPRTQVFTATTKGGSPWALAVTHSSGSLDGHIASTLRQNLALGFGILLLVAGAAAAIIVSSMRAKRLAQRQIDFVSSVSHEFRTPLAVIYSAGENLADGVAADGAQVTRYGDLIKGEGRKLSAMVEQILEFAGANAGKRKFKFAPTAVEDVVTTAVEDSRSLIDDRGFEIETSIASGLGEISADKTALSQAIQNLIANSIKYCNGKPWLRVSANNGNGRVRISVEDRGIGISRGDLKKIFEPFFRSKDVVDAQIHGNGLGLSLVKQIVDAHGGTIHVESESGVGSRFTIEIPSEKVKR